MIRNTVIRTALIIGVVVLAVAFGSGKGPDNNKTVRSRFSDAASRECAGANVTGTEYSVAGTRINVRKGPGITHERIFDRETASTPGETRYVQIDNRVTVLEACRKGGWSFIQVIEPEWLSDSHQGWVASRFLREPPRSVAGVKVFTEKDFIWDENTSPYKDTIIAAVNRIHRENSRCKEIDPSSASYSDSRSSSGKPVFSVVCGQGLQVHRVWFPEDGSGAGDALEVVTHIDKANAITICEKYARSAAVHLRAVAFSRGSDLAVDEHPNGQTTVISTFTGNTSLNQGLKFRIRCLLEKTGLIEASVSEAD
jgi:hypothetical protein